MDLPNLTGGSSKFSRIATPLTSMLKTSSTELAEPRKGVVGVGGGGRNRAELVGKYEIDRVDDDGGHSGDFDGNFQVVAVVILTRSFIRRTIAAPLTLMLKTSSSTGSSTSADNGRVDGAIGKLVKKLSKSRRIVKKKVQKASKV